VRADLARRVARLEQQQQQQEEGGAAARVILMRVGAEVRDVVDAAADAGQQEAAVAAELKREGIERQPRDLLVLIKDFGAPADEVHLVSVQPRRVG
jgi:hypothetical protein